MIRTFARCMNNMERIQFLQSLKNTGCSLEEIHSLCEIMSFEAGALAKESLLQAMIDELKARIVSDGCDVEKISKRISELDEFEETVPATGDLQIDPKSPFSKVLFPQLEF